jgi:hypothetical protein
MNLNLDDVEFLKQHGIQIVAFSGKVGSGKDYVAEHFFKPVASKLDKSNKLSGRYCIVTFADLLKYTAIAQSKVTYVNAYHCKTQESRRVLQIMGTEQGRDVYGGYVWVNGLIAQMRAHYERNQITHFIITDLRFPEELDFLNHMNAVTIRIHAPIRNEARLRQEANGDEELYQKIKHHASETALDNYTGWTLVFENDEGKGTMTNFKDQVNKLNILNC